MANKEHLAILKQGVEHWNTWRREHSDTIPSLKNANLRGARLISADLSRTDLSRADLGGADLTGADLRGTDLSRADLTSAILSRADLSGTGFFSAIMIATTLDCANLAGALFLQTTLGSIDLSTCRGLETVLHVGPSSIGIDTLYKSNGQIPDEFLRGAGVSEEIIAVVQSIRAGSPIQFHSCFISYSHKNEDFARKLHSRLIADKVRVWFAPEEMKAGRKLHDQIDEAIRLHDKLLLVMSDESILSGWVVTEVKHAYRKGKREGRQVLFPIRLTDYQTLCEWKCIDGGKDLGDEVREYYIPDFSNWRDDSVFEAACQRLVSDLKASEAKPKP